MKRLILLALCLSAVPALADNARGFYAGAGMTYTEAFDYPGLEDPVKLKSVELLGGYKYNNLLGVEVRYGGGYDSKEFETAIPGEDEEADAVIADTEYEIDSYYSVYYKPELINDEARLYGLIGYTEMERSVKFNYPDDNTTAENSALVARYIDHSPTFTEDDELADGDTLSTTQSGFSYGIGVGFFATKNVNINVEYRVLLRKSDERVRTAGLYFDYRF